jgi:putative intracellular protease/amidase
MKIGSLLLTSLTTMATADSTHTGAKQILMVVTSADRLADDNPTGLWLEEFVVPFLLFQRAGFAVSIASPKGGKVPVDARSREEGEHGSDWAKAGVQLEASMPLERVRAKNFDAIFLPGGHGTMIDFPNNPVLRRLLEEFAAANKVIAAVCHGPAGLVGVKTADGAPLVAGRTITAFTDAEEIAVQLDKTVPFLLETRLREEGAQFVAGEQWAAHTEVDGNLVTGQNPASSRGAAEAVIRLLVQE